MDSEIDEASILTDSSDESKSFDPQIGVDNLDPVPSVGPAFGAERTEGKHGLVEVHHRGL